MNSAKVGGMVSVRGALVTDCVGVLVCASSAKTVVVLSCTFLPLAITRSGSSSASGVLSVPSVGSRARASADW